MAALNFVSWSKIRADALLLSLMLVSLVASALFLNQTLIGISPGLSPPTQDDSSTSYLPQRKSHGISYASILLANPDREPKNTPLTGKGLVVVMPFTNHDVAKVEENLALWERFSPCNAAQRATEKAGSAQGADSGRIHRRRAKTAFYFYYNAVVDEGMRNFLWMIANRTHGLTACFDDVGHMSAFLTGDADRYDQRRMKSDWVRGPNNQFYSLVVGDIGSTREKGNAASTAGKQRAVAFVSSLGTTYNDWSDVGGEKDGNWPLSLKYQYLFQMEPDTRPIRSNWLDTLLYESGLPPFDVRMGDPGARVSNERFWMKGSVYRGKCVLEKQALEKGEGTCKMLGAKLAGHINGNALYNIGDPRFVAFLAKVRTSEYCDWPYDLAIHLYLTSPVREAEIRNCLHMFHRSAFVQNFGRYPFNVSEIEVTEGSATAFIHSNKQVQEWRAPHDAGGRFESLDTSHSLSVSLSHEEHTELRKLVMIQMERETRNLAVSFLPAGHMRSHLNRQLTKNWIMAWERFHRAKIWEPKSLLQRFTTGVTAKADRSLGRILLFVSTRKDFAETVKIFREVLHERRQYGVQSQTAANTYPVYRLDPAIMLSSTALKHKASMNRILEANTMALLMRMRVNVLRSPITAFWLRDPFTYFSPSGFYDLEISTTSPYSTYFPPTAANSKLRGTGGVNRISRETGIEAPVTAVSYCRASTRTVLFFEGLAALHSDRPHADVDELAGEMLTVNLVGVRYRLLEPALFPDWRGFFEKRLNLRAGVNVPYFVDAGNWVDKVLNPPDVNPKGGDTDGPRFDYGYHAWRYILEESGAWFLGDQIPTVPEDKDSWPTNGSRFLVVYERAMDNGLNNARNALRCALAISLILNRSLILPELHAHHRLNTPVGLDYFYDPQIFFDTWQGVVDVVAHARLNVLLSRWKLAVIKPPLFYLDVGYSDIDYRLLGDNNTRGNQVGKMIIEDGGWPWMVPNAVGMDSVAVSPSAFALQFGMARRLVRFVPALKQKGATVDEIVQFLGPWNHLPLVELSRTFRRFNSFASMAKAAKAAKAGGSFPFAPHVNWERIEILGADFEELFESSLVPSRMIRKVTEVMVDHVQKTAVDAKKKSGRKRIGKAGYACLHLRRGDFLAVHRKVEALTAQEAADVAVHRFASLMSLPTSPDLSKNESLSLTLYLASDESSSPELQAAFRKRFDHVLTLSDVVSSLIGTYKLYTTGKLAPPRGQSIRDVREMYQFLRSLSTSDDVFGDDQRLGLAEQELCANADYFVGNSHSTFSSRICQMRKRAGIRRRPCKDLHGRFFP